MRGLQPRAANPKGEDFFWDRDWGWCECLHNADGFRDLHVPVCLTCYISVAQCRMKHSSESERRSPSSDDDKDDKESTAEIQNPEDYKEIFQPKNSISECY